jgi:hypothetical protein
MSLPTSSQSWTQQRLGHHSPGFTLDVYSHAFPSQQREAARRFAQTVFGSGSGASPEPSE